MTMMTHELSSRQTPIPGEKNPYYLPCTSQNKITKTDELRYCIENCSLKLSS